ncbi:hypothetical protein ACF081_26930 [Streptomyces longwoodensis]|uniref:hypothetical protein n=1 Tax=Streptomyces longwoodensis TaxID=68231 RepID=UPI0036F780DA
MITKALHGAGVSGACAILATTAVIAAAPTADAATTTHCTAGNSSALANGHPRGILYFNSCTYRST